MLQIGKPRRQLPLGNTRRLPWRGPPHPAAPRRPRKPWCPDCRSETARCRLWESLHTPCCVRLSAGCASGRRAAPADAGGLRRGCRGSGSWRRRRRPARLVGGAEVRVVIQLADFPDAVFLGVLHLVHALRPGRPAAGAAEHGKCAPAPLRGHAAGIDVHHRLDVHVVVEAAVAQTDIADLVAADVQVQVFTNALLADEHPGRIVGDGVFREQLPRGLPTSPLST